MWYLWLDIFVWKDIPPFVFNEAFYLFKKNNINCNASLIPFDLLCLYCVELCIHQYKTWKVYARMSNPNSTWHKHNSFVMSLHCRLYCTYNIFMSTPINIWHDVHIFAMWSKCTWLWESSGAFLSKGKHNTV